MKTAISEDLAYTYSWVITSSLSPRWQVTPSHASHALGAHGSPFQPILAGILSDSFSAFIAATAETNSRSLEGKQGDQFAGVLIFHQSSTKKNVKGSSPWLDTVLILSGTIA